MKNYVTPLLIKILEITDDLNNFTFPTKSVSIDFLVCLIIFTVAYIISHTLSLVFSLINCITFFIIVYLSFNKGYTKKVLIM